MARFVVDTHALIWFLANNQRLGANAADALLDPKSELLLPAIVLAEALWIVSSKKVGLSAANLMAAIDSDDRITVCPLTREIVENANSLTQIAEMHDRQITATAMTLSSLEIPCSLITRDENISSSNLVDIVW